MVLARVSKMPLTLPLTIIVIAALVGALFMFFSIKRTSIALLVGAGAGVVGSLLFMAPLGFCTFEPQRTGLDVALGIILVITGMVLLLLPARWLLRRMQSRQSLVTEELRPGTFSGWLTPVLLLAPTLAILVLFLYYPAVDTFRLSTQLALLGGKRSPFICVDNFTSLVDPDYFKSVLITLGMSAAIVVIGLVLALLIASMAYQPVKGARIYRTLLIWPYAVSPVVAGLIFSLLFNPSGGLINEVLGKLFGINIPWLNDPAYAPWAVIIASVWKSIGFNILFYIAGLQNVPKDLLESGSIDGANALQRFYHVTLPLLSPITFFLVVTNITYAFFETVGTLVNMTGGAGPLDSTNTLMWRIYQLGVQHNDLGKSAAQAIVLFLMVIGITFLQFRTTGERVTYGA
jgi:sn-glycerol 3-phosphate transport system permease protein